MSSPAKRLSFLLLLVSAACTPTTVTEDGGTPPLEDAGSCFAEGRTCLYQESCCAGTECVQGRCRQCKTEGSCDDLDTFCCSGLSCSNSGQCGPSCGLQASSCSGSNVCCEGNECNGGFCERCQNVNTTCSQANPCCGGSECRGTLCLTCKPELANCNGNGDCCNLAECDAGTCGAARCAQELGSCGADAGGSSCCPGLFCVTGECRACANSGKPCINGTCCDGLTCTSGICVGNSGGGGGTSCQSFNEVCNGAQRCCQPMKCKSSGRCGY